MWVTCDVCRRGYDDAKCWTMCPHGPLGFANDDYCPKCDTLKTLHGPCRHQKSKAAQQLDRKHTYLKRCPDCGGVSYEQTCVAYGSNEPDRNRITCSCGWIGESWKLLAPLDEEPIWQRLLNLEVSIRKLRNDWLNGDDKCWKDLEEIFKLLPEGFQVPERDESVEIELCKQYIRSCHHPDITYISPQQRIEELEKENSDLKLRIAKANEPKVEGYK